MSYFFKPMMPFYNRFVCASTEWLMSTEGRKLIAKAIWLCRKKHGQVEARQFHEALGNIGCVYPVLRDIKTNLGA